MPIAEDVRRLFPNGVFRPPATLSYIGEVGVKLNVEFPDDLVELYLAFNGFWALRCHLWPLRRIDEPTSSLEQLNEIYRQYAVLPDEMKGILFFGNTSGERGLGYRLSDHKIVVYAPQDPYDIVMYADSVLEAYERDVETWNRL